VWQALDYLSKLLFENSAHDAKLQAFLFERYPDIVDALVLKIRDKAVRVREYVAACGHFRPFTRWAYFTLSFALPFHLSVPHLRHAISALTLSLEVHPYLSLQQPFIQNELRKFEADRDALDASIESAKVSKQLFFIPSNKSPPRVPMCPTHHLRPRLHSLLPHDVAGGRQSPSHFGCPSARLIAGGCPA
jgi:hypothetical protein